MTFQRALEGMEPAGPPSAEVSADLALLERAGDDLDAVEVVFARIDAGTDGACERCGAPIGDELLAGSPLGRHCRAHAGDPPGSPFPS